MLITCPTCSRPIPAQQINVAADVTQCASCGEVYKLSTLVDAGAEGSDRVDLDRPPSGVRYIPRPSGFDLSVTMRSGAALFLVPFVLVWSGFSIGGLYGRQFYEGKFDLFRSLFGIPFLLGTAVLLPFALMTAVGRLAVSVDGDDARIFGGVGPFGFTRRIDLSTVSGVRIERTPSRNGGSSRTIVLDGPKPSRFGGMLRDDRRMFVVAALRQALNDRRRTYARR